MGVVNSDTCGGEGILGHVDVKGSPDGSDTALLQCGTSNTFEVVLVPAAAHEQLALKVSGLRAGIPITIIETELPQSLVKPGVEHTLRFDVTPDKEDCVPIKKITIEISDAQSGLVETCATIWTDFYID